jgi:hypothetical protein
MTDILGGAPEADPDLTYGPTKPGLLSEPSTLAFIAFPLAILTVLGAQVFRGISYTVAFAPSSFGAFNGDGSSPRASNTYLVAGAFLTAAFSLLPLLLGVRGLRRLIPDDPTWIGSLLRAAIALAGLSFVLRVIAATVVALNADGGPNSVFNVIGLS